jgi:anti-anti-sigma factor
MTGCRRTLYPEVNMLHCNVQQPLSAQNRIREVANMNDWTITKIGWVTVVRLGAECGSLDFNGAEELRRRLFRLIAESLPPRLVIDCGNTSYAGSLFLAVLVRCFQLLQKRGGRFALCCLQPQLEAEIKALNLHRLWPQYQSLDEAVWQLHQPVPDLPTKPTTK